MEAALGRSTRSWTEHSRRTTSTEMDSVIARLVAEERIEPRARCYAGRSPPPHRAHDPLGTGDRIRAVGSERRRRTRGTRRQLQDDPRRGEAGRPASTRSPCRPTGRTTARSWRTFQKRFGLKITNGNPNGSSAEENTGRSHAEERLRVRRTSSTSAPRSRSPARRKVSTRPTATASGAASPSR